MRQIISLSLPQELAEKMKQRAKAHGHKSVSGYVQYLLTLDADTISEAEILKAAEVARAEYKKGKTVKASSMADLL